MTGVWIWVGEKAEEGFGKRGEKYRMAELGMKGRLIICAVKYYYFFKKNSGNNRLGIVPAFLI